jgi:hypothetical protein
MPLIDPFLREVLDAIRRLEHLLLELVEEHRRPRSPAATKADLHHTQEIIMTAVSDLTDRMNAAFDAIGSDITDIQNDVVTLLAEIAAAQQDPTDLTKLAAVADRADGVKASLDALKASAVPPAPPAA